MFESPLTAEQIEELGEAIANGCSVLFASLTYAEYRAILRVADEVFRRRQKRAEQHPAPQASNRRLSANSGGLTLARFGVSPESILWDLLEEPLVQALLTVLLTSQFKVGFTFKVGEPPERVGGPLPTPKRL